MKCNLSVIGDEFHFLSECPAYTDYHTIFVPGKFLQPPSKYDFCRFMSSTKKKDILAVSKFAWETNIA